MLWGFFKPNWLVALVTCLSVVMPTTTTAQPPVGVESTAASPSPAASGDSVSPDDPLRDCYVSSFLGGPSPLEVAAAHGEIEPVRLFLERYTVCNEFHKDRLLYFAAIGLQPEIVDLLLAYRADPLSETLRRGTPREALLACSGVDKASPEYGKVLTTLESAEAAMRDRTTRTEAAIEKGDFQELHVLLQKGVVKTDRVIAAALERDDAELAAIAVKIGMDIPSDLPITEWRRKQRQDLTATQRLIVDAVDCRNAQSMRIAWPLFAKEGLNTLDEDMTPLMQACADCSALRIQALREAGADSSIQNSEGKIAADFIRRDAAVTLMERFDAAWELRGMRYGGAEPAPEYKIQLHETFGQFTVAELFQIAREKAYWALENYAVEEGLRTQFAYSRGARALAVIPYAGGDDIWLDVVAEIERPGIDPLMLEAFLWGFPHLDYKPGKRVPEVAAALQRLYRNEMLTLGVREFAMRATKSLLCGWFGERYHAETGEWRTTLSDEEWMNMPPETRAAIADADTLLAEFIREMISMYETADDSKLSSVAAFMVQVSNGYPHGAKTEADQFLQMREAEREARRQAEAEAARKTAVENEAKWKEEMKRSLEEYYKKPE